jgi:predicted RND superfamily exporter protein
MEQDGWLQRCVTVILRLRWPTLVASVLLAVLAVFFARTLTIDTSLESWFLEDHETVVTYKQFRKQFGEDEFIVLAIEAENVFTAPVLGLVKQVTGLAEEIHHVKRVTSLANVDVLRKLGRGVRSEPLMKELPDSPEQAIRLQEEAASYPLVFGSLISTDNRAAAVIVELERDCDTFREKAAVVRALEAALAEYLSAFPSQPDVVVRIAGSPVIGDVISRHIQEDMQVLTPASFAVVVLSTFVLFRRFSVPAISLSVVALAVGCVLGVMGALKIQLNMVGPVLITIVMVVGVADSIHIFSAYFQELEHVEDPTEALRRALCHVLIPCFVTSLTTVIGFLSLLTSNLAPIREFGALAALGTAAAFVISILLLPAVLQCFPMRGRCARRRGSQSVMDWLLKVLGHPTRRVGLIVLTISTIAVLLAALAIPRIEITASPMSYFRPGDPARNDAEAIDRALGGTASLEFIVRAPGGGLKDRRVLKKLDAFEVWLEQSRSVGRVMSFGALLKEADRVRSGGEEQRGKLPRSNIALLIAKNLMQKSAPEILGSYARDDFSLGRISARVHATDADRLVAMAPDIEQMVLDKVNGPELQVEATGFVKLMEDMRSYLIQSQIWSIVLAFVTITCVLLVLFRSWKLALLSMIPNVGPIAMGLAFMAVFHIRLDPGTVMIATIALGLVVDDTCHFLVRLRQRTRLHERLEEAIAETMRQTGRPIILTSVILSLGFAVLIVGSFTPTVCFGVVCSLVLMLALIADLVVLPATLLVLRPRLTRGGYRETPHQARS